MNSYASKENQRVQTGPQPSKFVAKKTSEQLLDGQTSLYYQRALGSQAALRLFQGENDFDQVISRIGTNNNLAPASPQFHQSSAPPSQIQAGAESSQLIDAFEQQADQIADQLVQNTGNQNQPKGLANAASLRVPSQPTILAHFHPLPAPPLVHQVLAASGQPLDQAARADLEAGLGYDFSQIRVHTDIKAGRAARALHARAFTSGRQLVFAAGRYAPQTLDGRRLLAHELVHTLQQQSVSGFQLSGEADAPVLTAQEIYDQYASDNTVLGEELYRITSKSFDNVPLVLDVIDMVGWSDRDNVAYAFIHPLSSEMLDQIAAAAAGRSLLQRLWNEMGYPIPEFAEQKRIEDALAKAATEPENEDPAPAQDSESAQAVWTAISADQQIDQTDWDKLSRLDSASLESFLAEKGMSRKDIDSITLIAFRTETLCVSMRENYVASLNPDHTQILNEPLLAFIDLAFKDLTLTLDETRSLKRANVIREADLPSALESFGLNPRSKETISLVIEGSFLFSEKGSLLPIQFEKGPDGRLNAKTDPMIGMIQGLLLLEKWGNAEKELAHQIMLQETGKDLRVTLLQAAGLEDSSSQLIADKFFGELSQYILEYKLLRLDFIQASGIWALTADSMFNLSLPYFAKQLAEPGIVEEDLFPDYLGQTAVKDYRFPSGYVGDVTILQTRLAKHPMEIVIPISLEAKHDDFLMGIEQVLQLVPASHSKLINKYEFDPNKDPSEPNTAAIADPNGMKITIFSGRVDSLGTIIHEIGHLVAFQSPEVFYDEWPSAMEQDRVGISLYGFKSAQEDFAVAYEHYRSGGKDSPQARQRYPHRFDLLDKLEGK